MSTSSNETPIAFRLKPTVRSYPVTPSTSPLISRLSRRLGCMLIHLTAPASIPAALAKVGHRRKPASNTGAPKVFPTRSAGFLKPLVFIETTTSGGLL